MASLDERKRLVLRAVVEDYVRSAEPVGSRTIARKYGIGFSAATIRNEMADLEELGYLAQPHTSAGRIPSDKGYRFYVDSLMDPHPLTGDEASAVRGRYRRGVTNVEWLLQETVKLLSDATVYAALAIGPEPGIQRVKSLDTVAVGEDKALLVLVSDKDMVHHKILEIPPSMAFEEVQEVVRVLGRRLMGLSVEELGKGVLEEISRGFSNRKVLLDQVFDLLMETVTAQGQEDFVQVSGASKIMTQPEFHDVDKLHSLLNFLERPQTVRELLLEYDGTVGAVIGGEHRVAGAEEMSLVVAGLERHGGRVLRFGVVGPKRMDYGRVFALVEAVAQELDALLG